MFMAQKLKASGRSRQATPSVSSRATMSINPSESKP
jgi:hypothetical protein